MRIKSFKILALSMIFMLLSASSVFADNYFEKKSPMKICKTSKKTGGGVKSKAPKVKAPKIKAPKIKAPKIKSPKPNPQVNKKPFKGIEVTGITLNKTKTTIAAGSWERLAALVKPANVTNKHVLWFSTRPDIATVNPSGKVTGITSGEAVIYAVARSDFSKVASCTVTVTEGTQNPSTEVTGIYLNKTNTTLIVGSSETLTATVVPGNTSDSVTWFSGNPNIATVDQSGKITGRSSGTAQIFAMTSSGRYIASCSVKVVSANASVTSVSIDKTTSYIALEPGSTRSLTATVEPSSAADKSLTWTSGDTSVAVVNQSGKVTAISEGTAVITVRTNDGGKTDQLLVKVIPDDEWEAVNEVKINLLQTIIPVGEKDTLKYSLEPSDASNQEVIWTSNNTSIVSVTNTGVIEAKRTGTAVVTATSADGSKKASCVITVVPSVEKPAYGILFNKITSTLLVGMSDYPTVNAYPDGTSISSLTWRTSDSSVAIVTQTGKVTAIAPGNAVITATTSNNKTASYLVVVTE